MFSLDRRSLTFVTSIALVLLASSSAAAQSQNGQVVLQDGTAIDGAAATSVHIGVDVTVRLPDGSVRTYPWSGNHADPSVGTTTPAEPTTSAPAVHVQVAVGPIQQDAHDDLPDVSHGPRPGFVPVQLEASGAPIDVIAILHPDQLGDIGEEPPAYRRNGNDPDPYRYLCSTPCRLYVRPGGTTLHLSGVRQIESDTTIVVGLDGARIVLRSVSMGRPVGGFLLATVGTVFGLPGLIMAVAGGFSNPTTADGAGVRAEAVGFGLGMLSLGGSLIAAGIHLVSSSRTGVVRADPLGVALGRATSQRRIRWLGANIGRTSEGAWMARTGIAF